MNDKKVSPYDPIVLKALMIYSALAIIEDFMPDVKHMPAFGDKTVAKWTDNTLRYARLMVRRLEMDISKNPDPEAESQMLDHMHHVQKLVGYSSRLLPEDIITVTLGVEEFMKEHYEPKAYQSVLR